MAGTGSSDGQGRWTEHQPSEEDSCALDTDSDVSP